MLCGACAASYSETVGGTACVLTSECDDWWVWLVVAAVAVAYVVWLVFLDSDRSSGSTKILFFLYCALHVRLRLI